MSPDAPMTSEDPVTSDAPMGAEELHRLAGLLKALGETNRLSLVCRLCDCATPQQAMCLCECCNVDASGVSRHLKILNQEGIVRVERSGRQRTTPSTGPSSPASFALSPTGSSSTRSRHEDPTSSSTRSRHGASLQA